MRRLVRVAGGGVLGTAVLMAAGPGVAWAAAPTASNPGTTRTDSQRPLLSVDAADADGGALTAKFFARRTGSSTWDLINGTAVATSAGATARLVMPSVKIGQRFQWAAQVCDATACSALTATASGRVSPMLGAGRRPSATTLSYPVDDHTQATVDVGTGNLLVTSKQLTLPGVTQDVPVGLTFNSLSLGTSASSPYDYAGQGWDLSPSSARLKANPDGSVTYTDASGRTGLFLPVAGSTTAYTSPASFKADLAKTGTGWTLTDHASQQKQTFDSYGRLTTTADRNGNLTSTDGANFPTSVVSSRGTAAATTATVANDGYRLTSISQATSPARTVGLNVSTGTVQQLMGITDATGTTTTFGYSTAGDLISIINGTGAVIHVAYDSDHRVTSVTRDNAAPNSPGDSTTRLSYASDSSTLVADPTTDQTQPVAAVPHTTYTLTADGSGRVAASTDAAGRKRAATYTAQQDVASATTAPGDSTAGTTSFGHGANNGESLTSVAGSTGATSTGAYAGTGGNAYQPSSVTDDAGNATTLTYNGAGNRTSTSDASAANAQVGYNTDGTVASSTDPANGTNPTRYGYDTTHQLTSITAPAGNTLGRRSFTYDAFGRTATATDGRGVTTSYEYDALDRITCINFSDGTPSVNYGYDAAGRVVRRVDGSGTTSYVYDPLGQLISTTNTAGGGTISYDYDKRGALTATTDSRGTNTYTRDAAGLLTGMTVQGNILIAFANDNAGRRTDTWLQANADHTTWVAHNHSDYDSSGRVVRAWADKGTGDASHTRVFDQTYCFSVGSAAPTCPTTASSDRAKVQWVLNNMTGLAVAYSYDKGGRLTKAAGSGTSTAKTLTYTYDANGNRLTSNDGTATTALTYNSANQVTTGGYAYDTAGNQTVDPSAGTLGYDGAGRMTSATKAGTTRPYSYAGPGQNEVLATTSSDGHAYTLTYGRTDSNGLPMVEQVTRDGARGYIEHDDRGTPIAIRTSANAEVLYVYDGLGNPIGLLATNGATSAAYSYDPYGAQSLDVTSGGNAEPQNPYAFAQGLRDRTTGFIKYGARYYNPGIGRFTQQDTLTHLANPQQGNRYAYAGDDPINNADPTGRDYCGSGTSTIIGPDGSPAGCQLGGQNQQDDGSGGNLVDEGCALVGFAVGYSLKALDDLISGAAGTSAGYTCSKLF